MTQSPPHPELILASTSSYRRQLLERLGVSFTVAAPQVDEAPHPDETPYQLVARLAAAKAAAVAARLESGLVIGSDQVATLEGRVLGKPGAHPQAVNQLRLAAGKRLEFLTGVALHHVSSGRVQVAVERFTVVFRALDPDLIERYLLRERPYDCAGSFKSEALGIALCERWEGDDPTALVGLPLMRLVRMLEAEGVRVV